MYGRSVHRSVKYSKENENIHAYYLCIITIMMIFILKMQPGSRRPFPREALLPNEADPLHQSECSYFLFDKCGRVLVRINVVKWRSILILSES